MSQVCQRLLLIGTDSIHTRRYLKGIAPYCGSVVLITNQAIPKEELPENLLAQHVTNFSLRAFGTAKAIRGWIKQYQPDIAHVQQANSVAWHAANALKASGIPWVLSCWGSDVLLLPKKNWLMKQMVKFNLLCANAVTADSQHLLNTANAVAGKPLNAHMLVFGLEQLPSETVLTQDRPKRILSCRLHKPLYRIDAIIHAFAELVKHQLIDADWQLEIAARGEQTDELKALVDSLGLNERVFFSGFLPHAELLTHYLDARVFVSVPESDSTPVSLLEAMGSGCYPVLSDLPANREWVVDGETGEVCREMSALANKLQQAIAVSTTPSIQPILKKNYLLIKEKAMFASNMAAFAQIYSTLLAKSN